jgi:hypothetical protein
MMPHFNTAQQLDHTNLHDDFGRLGGSFPDAYERKVRSIVRPIQKPSQFNIYPSRLVGPDGVTYLTKEPYPEYVVISYTWGRWKLPERDLDTRVNGGHWEVPANRLFSREDLDLAVRKISGGGNAWVDVLCIPQIDSDPEQAQEIGKQGEIFRSASRAAVWLCSGGEKTLAEICSWVPEKSYLILPNILTTRSSAEDFVETSRRIRLIGELTAHVPWTTSLWTLQEAVLRLDAIFYDKAGNPVRHEQSGNPITIKHLVKTLRHVNDSLHRIIDPSSGSIYNIIDRPDGLGMSEEDIAHVFKALDAVNTIFLHKLLSMNASELLMTSSHRSCERPHDRVYGIMGAIGVVVPVDYSENPSRIMDMFLVELHNKLPAEMQSFHREGVIRPSTRQWLADEGSRSLTLIRQLSPPPNPIFTDIAVTGDLIVSELFYISDLGLDELTARFLAHSVAPAFDTFAFMQITNGAIHSKTRDGSGDGSYVLACSVLKFVASKIQLGLLPLGTISGLEELGWSFIYMLVGSNEKTFPTNCNALPRFKRLGVMVMADELSTIKPIQGRFLIY